MEDKYRITNVEDKYFRVPWYVTVVTGTTGTITPPTGGTLVLDQWPGDVDAKASTIVAGEMPTGITPKDTTGADIVVTMSSNGAWSLSGTPTAYPIAIIYYYDVKLFNYNRNRDLGSIAAAADTLSKSKFEKWIGEVLSPAEYFTSVHLGGLFDEDSNSDLMPSAGTETDTFFVLDSSDNIQPGA